MTFLWPLALGLLVPWAVACVRLARRGDAARPVPFVRLWPASPAGTAPRRGRPPLWAILVLAGTLATILAAAGPARIVDAPAVTVVVDRGPALTPTRLRQAFDRLNLSPATAVRVIPVPGEAFDGFDTARLRPTAVDALPQLRRVVRDLPGPAVVLTDRPPDLPPGVAAVTPPTLVNAGIDRFALTSTPQSTTRPASQRVVNGAVSEQDATAGAVDPEDRAAESTAPAVASMSFALVRVFNATPRTRAMLDVAGVRQAVELPPSGQTKDYFFDVPSTSDTATARLLAADGSAWRDDVPGDDAAYLARSAGSVRIEPQTTLPDALARFVAVYARHRPAGVDATAVAVVRETPATDRPAVVLPTAMAAGTTPVTPVTLDATHDVARSLDPRRLSGRPTPSAPSGDGWRGLAWAGDATLLAARASPARQVWVGFDADALANDAAYVLFWTDVFDWLAGGAPAWQAAPVGVPGRAVAVADPRLEQSPGLYEPAADAGTGIGRVVATAMPAVRPGAAAAEMSPPTDPFRQISRRTVPLGAYFLLAGIVLITVGLAAARLDRN